ncbi:MAG: hypothetical protein ACRDOI_17050 [Trebonia sp.]
MHTLNELDTDALKVALQSADALLLHKAYLPGGGLLVMLLGRFRDDVRDVLDMEREDMPRRGKERRSLDMLTSVELDTVCGAATILLQDRFRTRMDDPALPKQLTEFREQLTGQKVERAQIRSGTAS